MIVSRLPPSRFTGAIATSLHTAAFNCFVSTARRLFFLGRWETMIFKGDPGVDEHCGACVRFVYRRGFNTTSIWLMHDVLATKLNDLGESGMTLEDAAEVLMFDLAQREIIEKRIFAAATRN